MAQLDRISWVSDDFHFSDDDFDLIANIAHREFGLYLPASKKTLVYSRLARRVRALNLDDFSAYCALLNDRRFLQERQNLLSSLTTNVTHFYREEHHFKFLKERVFPELIKFARLGRAIRLWSAGCSAGHEPYSLAFCLLEHFEEAKSMNIKILATDIDPVVVELGAKGVYSAEEISHLTPQIGTRFFIPKEDKFEVVKAVRDMVAFAPLNLIEEWPMQRRFDLIMCRNTAIYFDKSTQETLWKRFSDQTNQSGYLFVGHSERLSGKATSAYKNVGVTAYQKVREL